MCLYKMLQVELPNGILYLLQEGEEAAVVALRFFLAHAVYSSPQCIFACAM
jgi:hypothetical protein